MKLAALLAALAGIGSAAVVEVPVGDPSIRYLGRTSTESWSGDVRWDWSAAGAAITFSGTACSIHLQAQGALYDIYVDGKRTDTLDLSTNSDTLFPLASALPAGVHTVAARSRTEANYSVARFRGFRIDGTPQAAAAAPDRRIEFYGNSITCGYGILDTAKEHGFSVHTEEEALTYAALASDSVGAERHVECWSGRGVIQNYGGSTADPTLPMLYQRAGVYWDSTTAWDFSKWIPQVVAIDLGTNDYSTSLPDSAKFHRVYKAWVDSLHVRYPAAKFVLLDGPMLSPGSEGFNRLRKNLDDIASDLVKEGIQASHLALSPQDGTLGYGADWHPSRKQAAKNGQELAAFLRTFMGWGATSIEREDRLLSMDRPGLVVRSIGGHLVTGWMRDGRFEPLPATGRIR
jgi:hypothetical protein